MLLHPQSFCFKKSWSLSTGSKIIAVTYTIFAALVLTVLSLALINIDATSRQLSNMRNWTEIPLLVVNSLIFPEKDAPTLKKNKHTTKSIGNITNKRTAKVLTNMMSFTVGNTEESTTSQNDPINKKEPTKSKKNEIKKSIKENTARIYLSDKSTLKVPEIESTTTKTDSIIKEEPTKSKKNKNKSVKNKTTNNLSNNSTIKVPEIEEILANNEQLMSKRDSGKPSREKLVNHELSIQKLGKNRNSKRTGSNFPDDSTTKKFNQADKQEFGFTIISNVDETIDPEESFDKIEKEFKSMKIEKHLGNSSLNSLRNTKANYQLQNSTDEEVPKSPNSKKKSVKKAKTIFAYLKGSLIFAITLTGIYLSSCIFLMIGILKRSAKLVAPWVLIEFWRQIGALTIWACLTYHTINALVKADFINNVKIVFLTIYSVILVIIALTFYLWLVICSFYNELHGTAQSLPEENKENTDSMRITDLWAQPPTFIESKYNNLITFKPINPTLKKSNF